MPSAHTPPPLSLRLFLDSRTIFVPSGPSIFLSARFTRYSGRVLVPSYHRIYGTIESMISAQLCSHVLPFFLIVFSKLKPLKIQLRSWYTANLAIVFCTVSRFRHKRTFSDRKIQPVPSKMKFEMVKEMQIEILNGGEILVNYSKSKRSIFSVSHGTKSN